MGAAVVAVACVAFQALTLNPAGIALTTVGGALFSLGAYGFFSTSNKSNEDLPSSPINAV